MSSESTYLVSVLLNRMGVNSIIDHAIVTLPDLVKENVMPLKPGKGFFTKSVVFLLDKRVSGTYIQTGVKTPGVSLRLVQYYSTICRRSTIHERHRV
jgi:hypothetical protein